jgi:hypothetical protein
MVASASPGTGLGGRDMEARSIALPERPVDRPALRTLAVELARTALLTGVYVAAGKAAFALAFVHTSIAPVWPPSGIALAAVLLWGRRAVPGVLLGAFLFNASTPVPLWVSAAMGPCSGLCDMSIRDRTYVLVWRV